jgi:hypothetical protein
LNLAEKVLCKGEKRILIKEKRGKIIKVEILRGVFIGYKDILPRIDLARSEGPASLLLENVGIQNHIICNDHKGATGKDIQTF